MMKLIDRARRGNEGGQRRNHILAVARQLFLERGYDSVGMREIAQNAGISPALIYREGWTKADLLAELVLELNEEQIAGIEAMPLPEDTSPIERVLAVLVQFFAFDIAQLQLRRLGAAYGWLWSAEQEARCAKQLKELIRPLRQIVIDAGLDPVEPRVDGLSAIYTAAFRDAVFANADAATCIERIRPTVAILLKP